MKLGLWEDGKRIEWFSAEEISQINNFDLDYTSLFRNPESGYAC